MDVDEAERLHRQISLANLGGVPVAIGFVQLMKELRQAGVLSSAAEARVRDAIVGELTYTRPGRATADEFGQDARARLDRLLDRE